MIAGFFFSVQVNTIKNPTTIKVMTTRHSRIARR